MSPTVSEEHFCDLGKDCARAEAPRGPGRPRLLTPAQRECQILDATERVLARHGLQGASMALIAQEAGMSKRTLYDVFASRESLFAACVRRIRSAVVRPLSEDQQGLPLAARLRLLLLPAPGAGFAEVPVEIMRAVIAEAPRHPELAHEFREEGPLAIERMIRAELDQAVARGEVVIADTAMAARLLRDMAYESALDRLTTPPSGPRPAEQVQARLDLAIGVFLGGIAAVSLTHP